MRTIKFRGKRKDNGEWVYGDLIHGVGPKHGRMYILLTSRIYPEGCSELDGWNVIPETVGQFTGLTDKDRKDGFDGDIVRSDEYGIGVITWSKEDASFFIDFGDIDLDADLKYLVSCEIIGNMHDNPIQLCTE